MVLVATVRLRSQLHEYYVADHWLLSASSRSPLLLMTLTTCMHACAVHLIKQACKHGVDSLCTFTDYQRVGNHQGTEPVCTYLYIIYNKLQDIPAHVLLLHPWISGIIFNTHTTDYHDQAAEHRSAMLDLWLRLLLKFWDVSHGYAAYAP